MPTKGYDNHMIKSNIFMKTMLFTFVATVSYFIFIATFAMPKIEDKIAKLEEKNVKDLLNKIVILSRNVHYDLEHYKKTVYGYKRENLKGLTDVASNILYHCYTLSTDGNLSTDDAKRIAYDKISGLSYGKGGYFFIVDDNYTMLSYPDENMVDKNILHLRDDSGKLFVRDMVNKSRDNKHAFVKYSWHSEDDKKFNKLTYIREFKNWGIHIGTGVSIEDIELEVKNRKAELNKHLTDIIKHTKICDSGYIYIFDKNGTMLVHPNSNLVGVNIMTMVNPSTGKMLYDDLVYASKHSGKLRYIWDKPNDRGNYIYKKISWIEYIPELKWYIASSAYVDELDSSSNELKYNMYIFGIVILILFLIISFIFFKKLFAPILNLADITSQVTKGNYKVRSDYNHSDEIGILCQNFNTMIDTIEENIKTLDKKVEEKTRKLHEQKNLLYHQAHHDALTGLPNRMYFNQQLEIEFQKAKDNQQTLTIFFMDLDRFKQINDTLGHKVGDEVLRIVSKRFDREISSKDTLVRLGGDEFVLMIRGLKSADEASNIAEGIIRSIKKPMVVGEHHPEISVSIGISLYPLNTTDMTDLLKHADIAMYQAKKDGRNRFRICTQTYDTDGSSAMSK